LLCAQRDSARTTRQCAHNATRFGQVKVSRCAHMDCIRIEFTRLIIIIKSRKKIEKLKNRFNSNQLGRIGLFFFLHKYYRVYSIISKKIKSLTPLFRDLVSQTTTLLYIWCIQQIIFFFWLCSPAKNNEK